MGFLERLRQEKEVREREAQRQAQIVKSLFHQQQESKRQTEAFRHNQRMRAEQMLDESGIYLLLSELEKLLDIHGSPSFSFGYGEKEKLEQKRIPIRDIDSFFAIFRWDKHVRKKGDKYDCSEKYFAIEVCPDGVVKIDAASSGGSIINSSQWRSNTSLLEGALEKAFNNPRVHKWSFRTTSADPGGRGPCLPGYVLISAPISSLPIKNLRVGDFVWTIDRFGQRVKTVIVKKAKRIVSKNHKAAHIVLKDGRELVVSPGHPTVDYRKIGSLVKGDNLDMSRVASIKVVPYKGKYTYDILPYGDTGGYWANNILIGSTLSSQFQRTISDGLYLSQVYTELPHTIRSLPPRLIGVVPMYFLT